MFGEALWHFRTSRSQKAHILVWYTLDKLFEALVPDVLKVKQGWKYVS